MPRFGIRLCATWIAVCSVGLLTALAPPPRSQSYGYSYLRITVAGRAVSNLVLNEKYVGWIQIDEPAVWQRPLRAPSSAPVKKDTQGAHWAKLTSALKPGRLGPGRIRFGAGDSGDGLKPLIDAQKDKRLIDGADLDVYNEDTSELAGKFRIRGIQVLALEDVQASACPMFEVTISFQSIAPR